MRTRLAPVVMASMFLTAAAAGDNIRTTSTYQPLTFQPAGILATDLTGNGRDDVIVLGTNPVRYQIFHALDDGEFEPQQIVTLLGTNLASFTKADINNNGLEDLLILSNTHGIVHILLNNADGQLTPAPESPMPTANGEILVAADMNQSGKTDIVVASSVSALVHHNLGDAVFSVPQFLLNLQSDLGNVQKLVIEDFNADGLLDVAVLHAASRLRIIHATPAGSWQLGISVNLVGGSAATILAADVNHDGVKNLVWVNTTNYRAGHYVFNPGTNAYEVREPAGPGTQAYGAVTITGAVATTDRSVQRADIFPSFMGDGVASVISADTDEPGIFREIIPPIGQFAEFRHVTLGDINGNGRQDVIYATTSPFGWVAFPTDDQDSYRESATYTRTALPSPSTNLFQAMLRNDLLDGTPSFILAYGEGPRQFRRLTPVPDGAGHRLEIEDIPEPSIPSAARGFITNADINGDGIPDLISIGHGQSVVLLGKPDGGFEEAIFQNFGLSNPTNPVLTDLNANGRDDLVLLRSDGIAYIYHAQPDGSFSEPTTATLSLTSSPGSLAVADLDADGYPDLLCLNRLTSGNGAVYVAYGRPDGSFEAPVSIPTFNNAGGSTRGVRLVAADFTNNGLLDIAVASTSTIAVNYATGPRQYTPPQTISTPIASSSIEWIQPFDVNADGRLDLVAVRGRVIEVLHANPQGNFEARSRSYSALNPVAAEFIDLNADGLPDVIYATGSGATILYNRSIEPCLPDLITDGVLNLYDIARFIQLFNAGDPRADFNGDGLLNFFDFVVFFRLFNAGCP
ncbi:MAG: FG-GAP-like repeat-containing protein [Phycisphaerales bacterium]|nr:VCBS repeat-containing protein [Planctomycetota bacterium]MCH8509964.1 FG-GAP-like repeat-containing protein [Phycisphaerales bacterium]